MPSNNEKIDKKKITSSSSSSANKDTKKKDDKSSKESNKNKGDEFDKKELSSSSSSSSSSSNVEAVVHPLVLLSAVHHYHRTSSGTRRRSVGVLLGSAVSSGEGGSGTVIDCTNSFALPFEEDSKNPAIFYLDHNYLENMLAMFRKINAKERVVGFYSTGPTIRPNDLRIHSIVSRFLPSGTNVPCVLVIIDVRPVPKGRARKPTTAYRVVEGVDNGGDVGGSAGTGSVRSTFAHVASSVGACEPEEVGVEHLLRDVHDPSTSTVGGMVKARLDGLDSLAGRLRVIASYLRERSDDDKMDLESSNTGSGAGGRKPNSEIVSNAQTILGLLPNLNAGDLPVSVLRKTNDDHMAVYLGSLVRAVLALHDLVNNKIRFGGEDGILAGNIANGAMKKVITETVGAAAGKGGEEKKESDGAGK